MYEEKKSANSDYRDTPLWDSHLSIQERVNWLLGEMTLDEKFRFLSTGTPAIERLGITPFFVGGEAAHGVEARHDQGNIRTPDITTSFPQPIGMSASWDTELLEKAGRVVGKEARTLYENRPEGGLFRWAPTVDIERDPRWGRTEEGYGEDPFLTGKTASAYVRGMQGDDPEHLLISAALKHFFANNVENGRGVKSSSIDARGRNEYYYEPFRRLIMEGGATSMMTAYNKVNGVVQMLDHRVNDLVRDKWGLDGHVVCDGAAFSMACNMHHATASHAETLTKSLKAGVDCMTDKAETVEAAAREAYEKGWITEEDIDRALTHTFSLKLRLGLYDKYRSNPWSLVKDCKPDNPENRAVSRQLARESVVLLKNSGILPLQKEQKICVLGPLSNVWYQDWYGGEAPYWSTVLDGVRKVLEQGKCAASENQNKNAAELLSRQEQRLLTHSPENIGDEADFIPAADGLDRIYLRCGDGYAALDEENLLIITPDRTKAEKIVIQDWGFDHFTFYFPRVRKYLSVRDDGYIAADRDEIFSWFVKECFTWKGSTIETWYHSPLCVQSDGHIAAEKTVEETPVGVPQGGELEEKTAVSSIRGEFTAELFEDGTAKAVRLAAESDTAILVLGSCPTINGKEDADRPSIEFPPAQRKLAQAVFAANPNTVLVLISNYPYAIDWEQEHLPAILWTASGSQDMGIAAAETLFGVSAPAGRLNMTWYPGDETPPDMDDYDIVKTKRTYRYYDGKPLYAFGHGLTYAPFSYRDFRVTRLWGEADESAWPAITKEKQPTAEREAAVPAEFASYSANQQSKAVKEGMLCAEVTLGNQGNCTSDEVVQIYVREPAADAGKPIHRLVGFQRVKQVLPGEERRIKIFIPLVELRYYDVVSQDFLIEDGAYTFEAAAASDDIRQIALLDISGARRGIRAHGSFVPADHWDDYENLVLDVGHTDGREADDCSARIKNSAAPGRASYRSLPTDVEKTEIVVWLRASEGGSLEIYSDSPFAGKDGEDSLASAGLDAKIQIPANSGGGIRPESGCVIASWSGNCPEFEKIILPLKMAPTQSLDFVLHGSVQMGGFYVP